MVTCKFVFDVIVVRIAIPGLDPTDSANYAIDVLFNEVNLSITSSRINVNEFRSGSSYEFEADPATLPADLAAKPIQFEVFYEGRPTGGAKLPWPEEIISKIDQEMEEVTHTAECALRVGRKPYGVMEVIVRLRSMCNQNPEVVFKTCDDVHKHFQRLMDPKDILFLVGQPDKEEECPEPPECTCLQQRESDSDSTSNSEICVSKKGSTPCHIPCPKPCQFEDNSAQAIEEKYREFLDSVLTRKPPRDGSCRTCEDVEPYKPFKQSSNYSFSSGQESTEIKFAMSETILRRCQGSSDSSTEKFINICKKEPMMDFYPTHLPNHRECLICKEDMTWLPKLATCPKCNYKPEPYMEDEKSKGDSYLTDQILHAHLNKCTEHDHDYEEEPPVRFAGFNRGNNSECCEEKRTCRCTCKNGKICAHCRIRKVCQELLHPHSDNYSDDCGKCEEKSSAVYNVCKSDDKDCRPYLARVFSELKDLYDIKGGKQKKFVIDPRCEHEFNKSPTPKKLRRKGGEQKKKTEKANETEKKDEQEAEDKNKETVNKVCYKNEKSIDRLAEQNMQSKKKLSKSQKKKRGPQGCCRRTATGIQIGRKQSMIGKYCNKNVPRNMGWLWTLDREVCSGWRPGAVSKPIKQIMKYFLKRYEQPIREPINRNQGQGDDSLYDDYSMENMPTLQITKRNGEYLVTMRPLKDPVALKDCMDPYLNIKPIQFKIVKSPLSVVLRDIKRQLKQKGFKKCTCHKPIAECICRTFLDKKRLEYHAEKMCEERDMDCCNDTLVLSDTTDSDVEFDFAVTPPAGVVRRKSTKTPKLVSHGTQYLKADCSTKPIITPMTRYMQLYNCATGERYARIRHGKICKRIKRPSGGAINKPATPATAVKPAVKRSKKK